MVGPPASVNERYMVTEAATQRKDTQKAMATTKTRVTPGQIHPLSIILTVWGRRWFVLAGTILLSAAAYSYIRQMPDVYRTDAVIIVDSQKIPEKFVASTVQVSLNDSVSAISQQVLSSGRLQKIIADFDLYPKLRATRSLEEVLARFRSDLQITVERALGGGRSGAFRISFSGADPKAVAGVVNRVADLFVQENVTTRERRAEGTSDFIEAQLEQAKSSLEQQERNLSQFKLRWNGELPQQEAALLQTLNRLQLEFEANQQAINRAEQSKVVIESGMRFTEASLASLIRSVQPSPFVNREKADTPVSAPPSSVTLRAKLQGLLARYYEDHPEVRRTRKELELAVEDEKRPAEVRSATPGTRESTTASVVPPSVPPQILAEINREKERLATSKTQLELLNREIADRQAQGARIRSEMSAYSSRVEKLPIREQQIASLTRDYETTRANYHSLLDKKMSAEMAREMERQHQSERFTVTDAARVPTVPVKPKRMLLYAGSGVGSLAFCVMIALGLGLKANTFQGEWELPAHVRVIGRIYYIQPAKTATNEPFDFDFSGMAARQDGAAKV